MAWNGYFTYGGNEFINLPRTEKYASGTTWFKPTGEGTDLPAMNGDVTYTTPIVDNAPWTDPDDFASYEFWGFYPLAIQGIEDATVTSTVVESTGDGGTPGRVRRATKTLVFNGLVLASSECGAAYGVKWLRNLLNGNACGNLATQTCNGDDLCYLDCEPALNFDLFSASFITVPGEEFDIDGGAAGDFAVDEADGGSSGSVTTEVLDGGSSGADSLLDFFDGGSASSIPNEADPILDGGSATPMANPEVFDGCDASFSCVPDTLIPVEAADLVAPAICFTESQRSLRRVVFNNGPTVLSKNVTSDGASIWNVQFTAVAGNPYEFSAEKPIVTGFMDPTISNPYFPGITGLMDLNGRIVDDEPCTPASVGPVFDPLCPALVVPPSVPNVPLGCYTPPVNWHRRQFTIPNFVIPLHSDAVPLIRVYARDDEVRNLRLRFYSDVNGDGSILDDPCAWCGDIVMSFIPHDTTLVFDASDKTIYVEARGGLKRRADNLVYATDGGPFEWPALTCGFGYVVTVDLPQTQVPPVVDLSLFNRVA